MAMRGGVAVDYEITMGSRQVGKVQLLREGLYVRVVCHVQLCGSVVYRLAVEDNGRRENLGVLMPEGGGYSLDKRIPAKRFPQGEPEFLLVPAHEPADGRFLPIHPQEPFEYLSQLKDAYMKIKDGRLGISLPE